MSNERRLPTPEDIPAIQESMKKCWKGIRYVSYFQICMCCVLFLFVCVMFIQIEIPQALLFFVPSFLLIMAAYLVILVCLNNEELFVGGDYRVMKEHVTRTTLLQYFFGITQLLCMVVCLSMGAVYPLFSKGDFILLTTQVAMVQLTIVIGLIVLYQFGHNRLSKPVFQFFNYLFRLLSYICFLLTVAMGVTSLVLFPGTNIPVLNTIRIFPIVIAFMLTALATFLTVVYPSERYSRVFYTWIDGPTRRLIRSKEIFHHLQPVHKWPDEWPEASSPPQDSLP